MEDARDWGRLFRAGDLEGRILHTHLKGDRVAQLDSRRVTRVILTYRDNRSQTRTAHRLRVRERGQQEDELSASPQPHHVALVPPRTSSARRWGRHRASLFNATVWLPVRPLAAAAAGLATPSGEITSGSIPQTQTHFGVFKNDSTIQARKLRWGFRHAGACVLPFTAASYRGLRAEALGVSGVAERGDSRRDRSAQAAPLRLDAR